MSGVGKFIRRIFPVATSAEKNVDINRARGIGGALDSYSKRKAAERIALERDAAAEVYEADTRLARAKGVWAEEQARLALFDPQKIRQKVERENYNDELRIQNEIRAREAEAALFERKFEREDLELETDIYRAKFNLKKAKDEFNNSGTVSAEDQTEPSRKQLEQELSDVQEEIEAVLKEWDEANSVTEISEAQEQTYNKKFNRLHERLNAIQTKLDEL